MVSTRVRYRTWRRRNQSCRIVGGAASHAAPPGDVALAEAANCVLVTLDRRLTTAPGLECGIDLIP